MSSTAKQDSPSAQPWDSGATTRDLPCAVAAAIMALPWINTATVYFSAEAQADAQADKFGQVQEIVARYIKNWAPTQASAPSGILPENLERADALHRQWHKLCQLEAATYRPQPGKRRLCGLGISAAGMGRIDYFDVSDLEQAGINLDDLGESILTLLRCELGNKITQVHNEMYAIGMHCQDLVKERNANLTRLKTEMAHNGPSA
jgi:hypothetical protein